MVELNWPVGQQTNHFFVVDGKPIFAPILRDTVFRPLYIDIINCFPYVHEKSRVGLHAVKENWRGEGNKRKTKEKRVYGRFCRASFHGLSPTVHFILL